MLRSRRRHPCSCYRCQSPCPCFINMPMYDADYSMHYPEHYLPCTNYPYPSPPIELTDYGPEPFVVNIDEATKQNCNFRTTLWTGCHLQLTLMCIDVGEDIGLENHPHVDQFIRIEEGQGLVMMGKNKDRLDCCANVCDGYAFIIPAGTWHNLINTGDKPIKLYSIYAPPQHPHGTIHVTKADAEAAD